LVKHIFLEIPQISVSSNIKTYELGSTGNQISWNATDAFPETYSILKDGVIVLTDQVWTNQSREYHEIDGLEIGIYNYTIVYKDYFLNQGSSSITVTVQDTTVPSINYTSSTVFDQNVTGNTAEWIVTDLQPNYAELFIDGNLISNINWTSETPIQFNLDSFSIGNHNLTLRAFDQSLNMAVFSTTILIVGEGSVVTSTTTITETVEVTSIVETTITSEVVTKREIVETVQTTEAGLSYMFILTLGSLVSLTYLLRKNK